MRRWMLTSEASRRQCSEIELGSIDLSATACMQWPKARRASASGACGIKCKIQYIKTSDRSGFLEFSSYIVPV